MIVATLLCILALLGLVDGLLTWWGNYLNIPNLTLELVLGYICYPIAFLLGVPKRTDLPSDLPADIDILLVGRLIGLKIITVSSCSTSLLSPALSALSPFPRYMHSSSTPLSASRSTIPS